MVVLATLGRRDSTAINCSTMGITCCRRHRFGLAPAGGATVSKMTRDVYENHAGYIRHQIESGFNRKMQNVNHNITPVGQLSRDRKYISALPVTTARSRTTEFKGGNCWGCEVRHACVHDRCFDEDSLLRIWLDREGSK